MTDPDQIVAEYLDRLESVAADLPRDRRTELIADVRDHIDLALADIGLVDAAAVRNVLERLGTPAEIVGVEIEAAGDPATDGSTATNSNVRRVRPISTEHQAILWLTIGAVVLPFIGPLVGLWTAATSDRWSLGQKRTAAMMVLVLLVMPAVLVIPGVVNGELASLFGNATIVLPLIPLSGIVAAAYLVASSSVVLTVSRRPPIQAD